MANFYLQIVKSSSFSVHMTIQHGVGEKKWGGGTPKNLKKGTPKI